MNLSRPQCDDVACRLMVIFLVTGAKLSTMLLPSFRKKRKLMIKVMILAGILGFLVSAVELSAAARLTNSPPANGNLVIGWDSRGILEKADQISGPWTA